MKKTSISIENGMQSSEPPTPPPPLLIDDLMPRKRFESLDEIFNFEKNILFGRETTLWKTSKSPVDKIYVRRHNFLSHVTK